MAEFPVYSGSKYRSGQQAFLKYGMETGMLAPDASVLGALPTLNVAGYIDQPRVSNPEGTQGVDAIGDYVEIDTVEGNREPSMSFTAKLGDATILRSALRSSALGGYMCLPVMALVTGALDTCGIDPFSWAMRYALINSLTLNFQEGSASPVTANIEAMGLAMDETVAAQTLTRSQMAAVGGRILTWHHVNWLIGSTCHRVILRSARVTVQNNLQRDGARLDYGADVALSRTNYAIIPGQEKLQVSYQLKDKLPNALWRAAKDSGNWGSIQLVASNSRTAGVGNVRTVTTTIANNRLSSHDLDAIQSGRPFGFSTNTSSRVIDIAQTLA